MAVRVAEKRSNASSPPVEPAPIEEFSWVEGRRPFPPRRRPLRTLLTFAAASISLFLALPLIAYLAGYRTLVVSGGSMAPEAQAGDALLLEDVRPEAIGVGDPITFRPLRSRQLTTHRVVRVTELADGLYFQTMGDSNPTTDPNLVPAPNVVGRVWRTIPRIGVVYAFADTKRGRLLLVVLPALLLIAAEAWTFLRRPRGPRRLRLVRAANERRLLKRGSAVAAAVLVVLALGVPASGLFTDSVAVGSNSFTTGSVNAPTLDLALPGVVPCRVTLSWTAPSTGFSPDGYDVLRSGASGGPYSLVQHVGAVTTTSDTTVTANTTYYYVIQSTLQNWKSGTSNELSATTALVCV